MFLSSVILIGCKTSGVAHFIKSEIDGRECKQLVYADSTLGSKFMDMPQPEISDDRHTITWKSMFIPSRSNISFNTGKITSLKD